MVGNTRSLLEKIKKAGLFTKGMVYFLLGGLTALAALGQGGKTSGKEEVSSFILDQPLGKLLLLTTALGLIAYSCWRFYQSYNSGQENRDDLKKRSFNIVRYLYSGLLYLMIAISFLKRALPELSSGNGEGKKQVLNKILSFSAGEIIMYILAGIIVVQALFQFSKGVKGSFMKQLDNYNGNDKEYRIVRISGRIGYIARGLVFLVIAYFLYRVAQAHNANEFQGTKGALEYIASLPQGNILLLVTSAGLLCYGIFNFLIARHTSLSRVS